MRSVVLSDIHIPVEVDMEAFRFALKIVKALQPDRVELLGDIADIHGLASFSKAPTDEGVLQGEIDEVNAGLAAIRKAAKNAKIKFIPGNHEDRLRRYIWNKAPGLFGLRNLGLESLFELEKNDIEYGEGQYKVGALWHCHGHEIQVNSGVNPARAALLKINDSIIFGHLHKFSIAHKQAFNGKNYFGHSNACLTVLDPGYMTKPDWVQGFSVVDYTKSGLFQVQQVHFWKVNGVYSAMVDGEEFTSKRGRGRPKKGFYTN